MALSLRNKLAVSHLAAIFFTAVLIGVGSYFLLIKYHRTATFSHLETTASHAATYLDSYLVDKENHLNTIAQSRDVQEFSITYRELSLAHYLRQYTDIFSAISYINPKGMEELRLAGQTLSGELRDFSENSLFRKALANPDRIIYRDEEALPPNRVLTMALAVKARFGENVKFVLVAEIPLSDIEHLLHRFIRDKEFLLVQDGLGKVLLYPAREFIGKSILPLFTGQGYSEQTRLGTAGYYAATKVSRLNWTIVVALPQKVYDLYPEQLRDRGLLAFLVTCLIGGIITHLISRKLTAPLISLTRSTRRIAEGKSTEPLAITSKDEVGSLIQSFNAMIATLQTTTVSRDYVDNIIQSLRECLFVVEKDGTISSLNRVTGRLLGYEKGELVGRPVSQILSGDVPAVKVTDLAFDLHDQELDFISKDGEKIPVLFSRSLLKDSNNSFLGVICLAQDLRQRKKDEEEKAVLQAQLQQAQRLETVGTLAGGIAHDFNNILTAIIGFCQLAKRMVPDDSPAVQALENSLTASFRAKDLVKQLLSFSRHGSEEKAPLQISSIVKEIVKLLRATIPTTIDIKQLIEPNCHAIYADASQIHQLIMNLCANSAQAMESGGTLTIAVANWELNGRDIEEMPELTPGKYIRLQVSDTGPGIDLAIVHRIFDPFFTTKDVDKGSGLGLAVVHGIVKRHGGDIRVDSKPGNGVVFTVYLPAYEEAEGLEVKVKQQQTISGKGEHILFVDDEKSLVQLALAGLASYGYQVTGASSSEKGLEIFSQSCDSFDLVVTDYAMPKMNGSQLAENIRRIRRDIPILLCTGYDNDIEDQVRGNHIVSHVVLKPYTQEELARYVREVLDDDSKINL